jgi:hypothetical protein
VNKTISNKVYLEQLIDRNLIIFKIVKICDDVWVVWSITDDLRAILVVFISLFSTQAFMNFLIICGINFLFFKNIDSISHGTQRVIYITCDYFESFWGEVYYQNHYDNTMLFSFNDSPKFATSSKLIDMLEWCSEGWGKYYTEKHGNI